MMPAHKSKAYMNHANLYYHEIIAGILSVGVRVPNQKHTTITRANSPHNPVFTSAPLVTLRKTAWKKAISEMAWFLSGDVPCPQPLQDWWSGQLAPDGRYRAGYGAQLRRYDGYFDQISWLIKAICSNPHSRRLIITTWNPAEMATITTLNENSNTPTTCHNTLTQFFVREGQLHCSSYQRSADILLGVPHNWLQTWALLVWLCALTDLEVGSLRWIFGDVHLYEETSHLATAKQIAELQDFSTKPYTLQYTGTGEFAAENFQILEEIEAPVIVTRPTLLI